ncbi:MAG: hypothetical protein AAFX81_05365 [Pseudomonadota bacterium]
MPPERPFDGPLDVVRHFLVEAERRDHQDVVAHVAIGKFAHDLELWAANFAERNGRSPTDDDLRECIRGTPAHRYDEILHDAHGRFANAAFEYMADRLEAAREQGDDLRLARASHAADVFLRYQANDRFDRLILDLEHLVAEHQAAKQPLPRLWHFGGLVLRGVLVTLVITALVYALLVILGADIGPGELIRRVFGESQGG